MLVAVPPRSSLGWACKYETCDFQVDDGKVSLSSNQAVQAGIQKIRPNINDHPLVNAVTGSDFSGRYVGGYCY